LEAHWVWLAITPVSFGMMKVAAQPTLRMIDTILTLMFVSEPTSKKLDTNFEHEWLEKILQRLISLFAFLILDCHIDLCVAVT
jgi:hypothetical protein